MAQERIGFFGKFQARAADNSGADKMRSLAGVLGQTSDLAFQIGANKRQKEGELAGLEEGRKAATEGRATEKKGGGLSIYGNAFDEAAKGSYISSIGLEGRTAINQFGVDHSDDPSAFDFKAAEWKKGILSSAAPEAYDVINEELTNRIQSVGSHLKTEYAKKVIDDSNETITLAKDELVVEASTLARRGDSGGADRAKTLAFNSIDTLVSSGGMKRVEAMEAKREITREVKEQKLNKKFDDIAESDGLTAAYSAIEEMRNDIPKGHLPDEWDSYISSAQTSLGRKSSRLTAMKKVQTEESKTAIRQYKESAALGFEIDPSEKARVYSLATTEAEIDDLKRIDTVAVFSTLSASDRAEIISSQETGQLIDVADYRAMVSADDALQEAAKKDGYALGVKQGIIEDVPFDATDPESYATKVKQAKILSKHYGVTVSPFSDEEASTISFSIDGMGADEKTELALTLAQSPNVWGQLASKNQAQFAMAGAIGDTDVMKTIFKGQDILDAGNLALKLPRDEYMPVFNDLVGDVYGTENKSAMLKAVMAYYAASGDQEMFDDSDFEAAIEAVSGGIGEINGFKVELPRGVIEDDFDDFIDDFSIDDIEAVGGVSLYTPSQAQELIQDGRIKSVGANQYEVIDDGGNKLTNAKGEPFTISYSAEAQRKKRGWNVALESKKFADGRSPTASLSSLAKRSGF
jgi:hypothetical protein